MISTSRFEFPSPRKAGEKVADKPDERTVAHATIGRGWPLGMRSAVMAAILLCHISSSAIAQGQAEPKQPDFPGLDIQALPGWDGYVDLSAPVPFSFLISNFTQDTIEGELTLTDPENDRSLNLGEVFIGPNGVRRFSSIQALPDWYQCIARFSHQGRILWQRELTLTTGKDFSDDLHYLLFVDDGTRTLQLPVTENAAGGAGRFTPDIGRGRTVQPLAVKTWQIPQHPGPLTVAQAIVFSETTQVEMLNDAQWDAVGKWICMGGTVFVHEMSADVIDRLKKAVPLVVQPGILFEELTVYRCGTGSIREYTGPLFSATDVQTSRQIAESASHLSRNTTMGMLGSRDLPGWENRNSEITRMWVVTIFVIYTLLSSSAMFFFRMTRRNLIVFTSAVVGVTCIAAIILGGFLRTSRGDLRWVTVTSVGPGGLLQLAKIDVQSAGGRNTQMTVQGRHADLQLSDSDERFNDHYYRYGYQPEPTLPYFRAFTWQASQLTDEEDAYAISVPINPWGRRRLYATAFQPLEHGVDIEFTYSPSYEHSAEQREQSAPGSGLNGVLKMKATSHLPFDLENCRLIVARSRAAATQSGASPYSEFSDFSLGRSDSGIQFEQVDSITQLGRLSASASLTIETTPETGLTQASRERQYGNFDNDHFYLQIPYSGATGIWIIAEIPKSPVLSIDQQRSDFEPLQEQHWYVQEIQPDQMPAEWLEQTQRLLNEEIKAAQAQAAAEAAAEPDER